MTSQIATQQRSLGVICTAGLCNRLMVLVSGLAIAEATGRHFYMLWPRTKACGASFQELFSNLWDIRLVDMPLEELMALADLPYITTTNNRMPDLLSEEKQAIVIGSSHTLLQPKHYPAHAKLRARSIDFVNELQIAPVVQERVTQFRQEHFSPPMIGVHARRGDFMEVRPDVVGNTFALFDATDQFLARYPAARIFLATDDGAISPGTQNTNKEGVKGRFRARYGDRVVYHEPRSLDRDDPEAIQDALIDLWLLRSTDYFVGTSGSTFSDTVVFGRDIPHILCGAPLPWYKVVDQISRRSGIQALFQRLWYRRYGRAVSFRYVIVQISARLQKVIRKIMPLEWK